MIKYDNIKKLEQLVIRLQVYNDWRRGADIEQPKPKEIGQDIDLAIEAIKQLIGKNEISNN